MEGERRERGEGRREWKEKGKRMEGMGERRERDEGSEKKRIRWEGGGEKGFKLKNGRVGKKIKYVATLYTHGFFCIQKHGVEVLLVDMVS